MKDLTMDYMDNARFNYIYGPMVSHGDSTFTRSERLCLAMVYNKFALQNGPKAKHMTLMQLSGFIELMFCVSDHDISCSVVSRISSSHLSAEALNSSERVCSLSSFINLFSIYLSNDLEKRMQIVFSIYDKHDLGYLNREHLMTYVQKFFTGDDEDEINEQRSDMVELLLAKFDLDRDMHITSEEYYECVRKQLGLLQFLGKVFPSDIQISLVRLCVNLL